MSQHTFKSQLGNTQEERTNTTITLTPDEAHVLKDWATNLQATWESLKKQGWDENSLPDVARKEAVAEAILNKIEAAQA